MKNSTKFFVMAGVAAMCGLSASAEATWQLDDKTWDQENRQSSFIHAQASCANFADLNNNGRLDVIYSGTSDYFRDIYGVWSWADRTSIYYNNGDGTWTPNVFVPVESGTHMENVKDAEGNDVIDPETGEPVQVEKPSYSLSRPSGLPGFTESHIVPLDYDNDGLLDLFVVGVFSNNSDQNEREAYGAVRTPGGDKERYAFVALFKNKGDGTFERIENHGIPYFMSTDDENCGADMYHNNVSVADYDHDGYVDLVLCGRWMDEQPEGYNSSFTALYRNVDGTGKFERKDIAEVIGGVWTAEIREEDEKDADGNVIKEGEVIKEKEELPGWFLPCGHNVHFVDLNNDGWVDIVSDGWMSDAWDGFNTGGSNIRIYLNREGQKFEDVTPLTPYLQTGYIPRGTSSVLADFDKDGYLDFYAAGYSDKTGFDSRLYLNQLSFADEVFGEFQGKDIFFNENGEQLSFDWIERFHNVARDFDGDGNLDMFFDGCQDSYIYYGDFMGNFTRAPQLPSRGYNGKDGQCAVGDISGNGLADQFQVGYMWSSDDFAGWHWGSHIYYNQTDVEVEAPAVPTEVAAELVDGMINVTWKDVEDGEYTCAYNVVVKTPSGKIISVIPADLETGFVKVSSGKEVAIRPMVQSYSVKAAEEGEYTVGVQAVSLYNERASEFATVKVGQSGIENVVANSHSLKVEVNGNQVTVYGDEVEAVKIVNILGQTVATGYTNEPINVEANGVLVVTTADKKVKIAK